MSRGINRIIYGIVIGLSLAVVLLFVVVDIKPYKPIFSEPQVWAHRGYSEAFPQNSVPAFRAAIDLGATGVEMDVFWDDELKTFVISHDKPYILPYGKLLTLPQLLDSLSGYNINYWLDLKNLEKGNIDDVIVELNALLDQYNCRKKVFVESDHGWLLRKIDRANIRTIYWVQFARSWPRQIMKRAYVNSILLCSNFDGITSASYLFDHTFRRHFNNYPVFVWNVATEEEVRDLLYIPGVNVVLTSANAFHLNPARR